MLGEEINTEAKVHIPSGTLETYLRTDWAEWTLVEDGPEIPVNVKLDYCGNDAYIPYGKLLPYIGNDVEIAMKLPASQLKAYANCKITAIEYYNNEMTEDGYTHEPCYHHQMEYVFLTSRGKDYEIKQEIKPIPGAWMRIDLPEPYIITDNDIFVGVGRHDIIGMSYANYDVVNNDSFQCRTMGSVQYPDEDAAIVGTWYPMGGDNHPFPIRVIVEGEHMPTDVVIASIETVNTDGANTNRVSARSSSGSYTKDKLPDSKFFVADYHSPYDKNMTTNPIAKTKGKESETQTQLKVKVRNRSPRPVRNVTLNWEIDGTPQNPVEISTHLLTNHEDVVYVDIPSEISGHTHNAIFNVTDIDGEADEIPENSTASTIFGTSSSMTFPRKYVMEEATGTWCQWCPRGMATIEYMKQQYPDNFIPIAIHYGDDMDPIDESYEAFSSQVSGYPAALLNRQSWIDVSPFELGEEKDLAQAMIKAYATFTDAGEIEVATETIFGFSERGNGGYRIAYVLLENNVGPYYQINAYSDPEVTDDTDELMNWWIHQDRRVKMRFNHVARSIHDYYGIENQLPSTFTEGETLVSMFTFPLPENVQDAE
ncbi:MAG: hypothetical protein K2L34_14175, partial [Muribaculaceae bacterium]|nr:hypothetical protein [Muribaculaceae bacterium]